MQAEVGMMQLQAKECQGLPAAQRSWEEARTKQGRLCPSSLQREHGPANTLILNFWPPEL